MAALYAGAVAGVATGSSASVAVVAGSSIGGTLAFGLLCAALIYFVYRRYKAQESKAAAAAALLGSGAPAAKKRVIIRPPSSMYRHLFDRSWVRGAKKKFGAGGGDALVSSKAVETSVAPPKPGDFSMENPLFSEHIDKKIVQILDARSAAVAAAPKAEEALSGVTDRQQPPPPVAQISGALGAPPSPVVTVEEATTAGVSPARPSPPPRKSTAAVGLKAKSAAAAFGGDFVFTNPLRSASPSRQQGIQARASGFLMNVAEAASAAKSALAHAIAASKPFARAPAAPPTPAPLMPPAQPSLPGSVSPLPPSPQAALSPSVDTVMYFNPMDNLQLPTRRAEEGAPDGWEKRVSKTTGVVWWNHAASGRVSLAIDPTDNDNIERRMLDEELDNHAVRISKSKGKPYYINLKTGAVSWEKPEGNNVRLWEEEDDEGVTGAGGEGIAVSAASAEASIAASTAGSASG